MSEFTEFEERHIILLALDSPDFFYRIASFIRPEYFDIDECAFIIALYKEYYDKYDDVPTREVLKEIVYKELKTDDERAQPVIDILNEELDTRNAKYIKAEIIDWAKKKQIALLYDEEVIEKVKAGDFDDVKNIIEEADKITDVIIKPFRLFDDIDELFIEDEKDHFTTGFKRLNQCFHDGNGPARREVFVWMAPTGVGKSIMLVNTSVANVLQGKNVLHVSLENDERVTGHRYIGAITNCVIANRHAKKDLIKERMRKHQLASGGNVYVLYFPTDTITVTDIEVAVKEMSRQYGFHPDLLVVDYLECLLSKNSYKNREDYTRQKAVSAELRALAARTNTCLFSASQTNRSGSVDSNAPIALDKIAESFGKAMPIDYAVSINQSVNEYQNQGQSQGDNSQESHIGRIRFFVAKNRNGPKFRTINAQIDYARMKVKEEDAPST